MDISRRTYAPIHAQMKTPQALPYIFSQIMPAHVEIRGPQIMPAQGGERRREEKRGGERRREEEGRGEKRREEERRGEKR